MKNRTETRPTELNMNLESMFDVVELTKNHDDLQPIIDLLEYLKNFSPVFYGAHTRYDYETETMMVTATIFGKALIPADGSKINGVSVMPIYGVEMPMTEAPEWLLKQLPENPSMHGAYYYNGKEVK